jgi:hypothetical protein
VRFRTPIGRCRAGRCRGGSSSLSATIAMSRPQGEGVSGRCRGGSSSLSATIAMSRPQGEGVSVTALDKAWHVAFRTGAQPLAPEGNREPLRAGSP